MKKKRKFISDNKKLLLEWDYELNSKDPHTVALYSHDKYHWICPLGHKYETKPYHRAEGKGCPYCAGRKVKRGFNDIATTHPDLLNEWDFENNKELTPYSVSFGSNDPAIWKCCVCGLSYDMPVVDKSHGQGCPYCAGKRLAPGYNDLETRYPAIAAEMKIELNGKKPSEFFPHCRDKVEWKCSKCGYEWSASIGNRTKKIRPTGCPNCHNKALIKGKNDLVALRPDIARLWDLELNGNKKPEDCFPGSDDYAFWKCDKGHPSFRARIYNMTASKKGMNCPVCRNMVVIPGVNDLNSTHSELAKEWCYSKNTIKPEEVTHGTLQSVYWECSTCGHIWEAEINSRASGVGCPKCALKLQSSLPEKAIVYYLSKFFDDIKENEHLSVLGRYELDIYIPSLNVGIEFDGENWHQDAQRDFMKDYICNNYGIFLIRVREEGCPFYESSSTKISCSKIKKDYKKMEDPINEVIHIINKKFRLSIPSIEMKANDKKEIEKLLY